MCYPFSPLNSRAADWTSQALDPNSALANGGGVTDPTTASSTEFSPFGNRKFIQGALRADLDVGFATITSLTSYIDYKQRQRTDGDGMALVAYDLQSGEGSIKSFTQELRIANNGKGPLRWLLGANYEDSKTHEDQVLRYFANSNFYPANLYINYSGDILNQKIKNYAAFGNLEYDVTDQLTIKASGRYTHSEIKAYNCGYTGTNGNVDKLFNIIGGISGLPFDPIGPSDCYTVNGIVGPVPADVTVTSPVSTGGVLGLGVPGFPFEATLTQHNFSWRAGLDYKITDHVLFYANVSRGYKAGSFPALAAAAFTSALPVTQEKVTAYEAGLKAQAMDGKVSFNLAGFYMDYRDKQVRGKLFDFIFGTLDALVNVPKSRIWGFEADATIRPVEGLTVSGAVTYLNSKITKFTGYDIFGGVDNANFDPTGATPNTENLAGSRIPYTPEWSGSVSVDYRHEMSNGGAPFAGFTVNARTNQSAAIGGEFTTLPVAPGNRYRIAPGVGKYPYMIDGYATVDARLGYEGPDGAWKVMLWGKNLFNKYYWTAVIPSSDSSARLAGKPVTYGITLGFKIK